MRPIPASLRSQLADEPRMKMCAASHLGGCDGRIEWHHVWIYASRQISEPWSIVGACHAHHAQVQIEPSVKNLFEFISLRMASADDLARYPRKPWEQIKRSLISVMKSYGN